jgi:hypothetical protein
MIRRIGYIGITLLLAGWIPQPVSAAILFSDNFNRAGSYTVGNNWIEQEAQVNDVSIVAGGITGLKGDKALQIQDETGTAAQLAISTIGYQNIVLSFFWAPLELSGDEDRLFVEWRAGSTGSWIGLASYSLGGAPIYTSSGLIALGPSADNVNPLQLEFRVVVNIGPNGNYDGAKIDNLLLTGDEIPVVQVQAVHAPEPASLAVWGCLAAVGIASGRRRRRT